MVLAPVRSDQEGFVGDPPKADDDVVALEERGWLPRHCRGDETAFPALIAAYRRPIYSFLVRAGVAAADRDDLFQTIFLNVHKAAARYQPARPLAPWLFTIAANAVRNHRRGARLAEVGTDPDELSEMADTGPDPERVAMARDAVSRIEQDLETLPAVQREVLLLTVVVGMAQTDVADALGLPVNTIKTHLRRARLALVAAHRARAGAGDDS